jgi:hypothetical protein
MHCDTARSPSSENHILTVDEVQWFDYAPTTQEAGGSIPAQNKHVCASTSLFVLSLDVSKNNVCIYKKK